jgi:hypothetical protein
VLTFVHLALADLNSTTLTPMELNTTQNGDGAFCATIEKPEATMVLYPIVRLDDWVNKARTYLNRLEILLEILLYHCSRRSATMVQ